MQIFNAYLMAQQDKRELYIPPDLNHWKQTADFSGYSSIAFSGGENVIAFHSIAGEELLYFAFSGLTAGKQYKFTLDACSPTGFVERSYGGQAGLWLAVCTAKPETYSAMYNSLLAWVKQSAAASETYQGYSVTFTAPEGGKVYLVLCFVEIQDDANYTLKYKNFAIKRA